MKFGYAFVLAIGLASPALAQVIVTNPTPPVVVAPHVPPAVVDGNVARRSDDRAANIEDRKAANQAAQGNYGNAARDSAAANADRAVGATQ